METGQHEPIYLLMVMLVVAQLPGITASQEVSLTWNWSGKPYEISTVSYSC